MVAHPLVLRLVTLVLLLYGLGMSVVLLTKVSMGTKSVLYGAHQFLIHPALLAVAWLRLYGLRAVEWWVPGMPIMRYHFLDPRLWVVFCVHDLGYVGKSAMDNEEGEQHPWFGARLVAACFDAGAVSVYTMHDPKGGTVVSLGQWGLLSLCHSRFLAKQYHLPFSPLCVADKMVIVIEPAWLYLPRVKATGEIREYMKAVDEKYKLENRRGDTAGAWHADMVEYLKRWIAKHKDGSDDTMTRDGRTFDSGGVKL